MLENRHLPLPKSSPHGRPNTSLPSIHITQSFVYEGKEGTLMHELNGGEDAAHKGGIYGVSWSEDNKRLITCSADKTVKVCVCVVCVVVVHHTF